MRTRLYIRYVSTFPFGILCRDCVINLHADSWRDCRSGKQYNALGIMLYYGLRGELTVKLLGINLQRYSVFRSKSDLRSLPSYILYTSKSILEFITKSTVSRDLSTQETTIFDCIVSRYLNAVPFKIWILRVGNNYIIIYRGVGNLSFINGNRLSDNMTTTFYSFEN